MSSDNGVYILKTKHPDKEGYEYRVAHAQAIDNLYYDLEAEDHAGIDSPYSQDFFDLPANQIFGSSEVYTNEDLVWTEAHHLASEISILEYGTSSLEHPNQVFKYMTNEEMTAEEKRHDAIIEQHHREREEERVVRKRQEEKAAITTTGPVAISDSVRGMLTLPDGREIHGHVLGDCVVTFTAPVKFLPTDWDKEPNS